jgi:cell division protein FtsL
VTRKRRRHHVGFAVLASALVASIVFGIVVLNVLLAQASFRIDEAERRIEALSADQVELVREQASLSAPGRIAHWASRHGMRLPDDIRILHPSGRTGVDPAGADPPSSDPKAASP